MKTNKAIAVAGLILCIGLLNNAWAKEKATEFVVAGSGTNLPLTRLLAKAFMKKYPSIRLVVPESIGSTGGIRAVQKGKISLGLASRPLRDKEKGWKLTLRPYARTIVVFAVHPSVPEENITTEEVLAIYSGKKRKWRNGERIFVISREKGDSGAGLLAKQLAGFGEIIERAWKSGIWRIEYRDYENNESIQRLKNAIGWSDLAATAKFKIKPLKFNGIEPTPQNLDPKKYPLYKTLNFVYQEPLNKVLENFLAFVKSSEGASIMVENGYIHIP